MDFKAIHNVYFIGVGGIGMSAIARYFNSQGKKVYGYDKTTTVLTRQLEGEGILVHYEDWGEKAIEGFDPATTLVVYTPAIPAAMGELNAFKNAGFNLIKRAKALGIISHAFETYAVAGTHGKTTTSAILAHVLHEMPEKCNAFIGGITSNYQSNCIIEPSSNRVVVEADEFDRSFLQLKPNYAIITTMDADHLDIYGDGNELRRSFNDFINCINPDGLLFLQAGLDWSDFEIQDKLKRKTYGFNHIDADWIGHNLVYAGGRFYFDITNGDTVYANVEFGLPGKHNAENALAVFGLCMELGMDERRIRDAFAGFKGVKRRFDFHIRRDNLVMIDDYAHHPTEITAFLNAIREIYPDKKITAVFQPHLFSRTRDFMADFATALALADRLFLLPVYPARELPIPGITSEVLLDKIELEQKYLSSKATIVSDLQKMPHEIILTIGAGDIDTCVQPIAKQFAE